MPRQPLMVLDADTYQWMEIMVCGISHCYAFTVNEAMCRSARVVPDGAIDLLINCRADTPRALFYGTPTKVDVFERYLSDLRPKDEVFGVRFLPGRAWWPGGLPISALTDSGIDAIKCGMPETLLYEIVTQPSFIKQVQHFMRFYMQAYQQCYIENTQRSICQNAVHCIAQYRGTLPISELSQKMGYSARYLGRVFNQGVGISPKKFSEIIRFQQVLSDVRGNKHLVDIAGDLDFCDQSHLLKMFKQFVGMSPQAYLKTLSNRGGTAMDRIPQA